MTPGSASTMTSDLPQFWSIAGRTPEISSGNPGIRLMPSSKGYKRDYKTEYEKQGKSVKAKKQRARNNKARQEALRKGKVKKGSTKDIAHSKPGAKGSTFVQDRSKNRSIARTKSAKRAR